ncbi:sugar ABC transporter ATP-binding protein [Paenibacillus psychroresistens]|uniref:Sugar ABC transporter ATP-binding protein n=2 Tax=Paenibacillus psychroresistens TaxID=1778678 RepID=A0A6B8RYQ3_9BACL|nr:sugar ABC transporter ATP-binding protein [Paenibacillus psychroresistens]
MKGISKSFSGVKALHDIDFSVSKGEIHALLGANGAGKSTLMKILSGAYSIDTGQIALDDTDVAFLSPREAIRAGIQCVYQEVDTALVAELNVAENIMIERITNASRWINWNSIYRDAEALLKELGIELPLRHKISQLSIAQKQLVLITRALAQQAKLVIFDEPTAPLSLEEAEQLFVIMRKLKADGVGCIFISHRLPEVFSVSDRVTVMRDGRHIMTSSTAETNINQVIEAMLGKALVEEFPKATVARGELLLEVKGLSSGKKVKAVDFQLHRGEIVGIVGLVGAGKTELSRLLFGADSLDSGEIKLLGRTLSLKDPSDAVREGIASVPEERRKQGVFVNETLLDNLAIPSMRSLTSWGILSKRKQVSLAQKMITELDIRPPDLNQTVKHLSGGNQQKVSIGKWIPTDAEVYLFDEPTKGVDIGAKTDIFRLIGELVQQGKGVLYFSCEIAEIMGIADRILVMSYGKVVKELTRAQATQDQILYYSSAGEADEYGQ